MGLWWWWMDQWQKSNGGIRPHECLHRHSPRIRVFVDDGIRFCPCHAWNLIYRYEIFGVLDVAVAPGNNVRSCCCCCCSMLSSSSCFNDDNDNDKEGHNQRGCVGRWDPLTSCLLDSPCLGLILTQANMNAALGGWNSAAAATSCEQTKSNTKCQ